MSSPAVDAYLATVARLEPDITQVDRDAALASIAISLKRIADALEGGGFTDALKQTLDNAAGDALGHWIRNR